MRSSLPSGKSATPPARCIHRPQRDTSSAEYRLLVSRASVGASRDLSSRRSPALIPYTYAVSPTFRYGAFLFVASALADLSSARLITCDRDHTSTRHYPTQIRLYLGERHASARLRGSAYGLGGYVVLAALSVHSCSNGFAVGYRKLLTIINHEKTAATIHARKAVVRGFSVNASGTVPTSMPIRLKRSRHGSHSPW